MGISGDWYASQHIILHVPVKGQSFKHNSPVAIPFPPIDSIWALVLVWRVRGKIIRTALLCCVRHLCIMICTQASSSCILHV